MLNKFNKQHTYYSILAPYPKSLVADKTFCSVDQKSGEHSPKVIFFSHSYDPEGPFFVFYVLYSLDSRKKQIQNKRNENRTRHT